MIKRINFLILFLLLYACAVSPDNNHTKNEQEDLSINLTIATVAGTPENSGYDGDEGDATLSHLNLPYGIAVDFNGNLYIADYGCNVIRKVSTNGIIYTVAGNGTCGFSGDNGPATNACLNMPWGVSVDKDGNIYIADSGNHVIRKVSTNGIISTIAGSPGSTEILNFPTGVCVDLDGNVYIADNNNFVIQKLNPGGTMSIVAGIKGSTGYSGDGGNATSALLGTPRGVFVDNKDNIFIADYGYNVIRKVNASGIITTIAGTGVAGYSGDGGKASKAKLFAPAGVFVDTQGSIYIADTGNNVVRKILTSGTIITIAGTGTAGYGGDNGDSTSALLNFPSGVCVDSLGNIYIADANNSIIRKVY